MEPKSKKSDISKGSKRLAIFLCFTPLISFFVIKSEWVARLLAVAGCIALFNVLIFWHGLNPKTNFISSWSKWARQTERTQLFGQRLLRLLTIIMALLFLWFLTVPVINDVVTSSREGKQGLVRLEGRVTSNKTIFGTYFFRQSVTVSEDGQPTGIPYQVFFYPKVLVVGDQLYQMLITPKSHLVLECDIKANSDTILH